MKVRSGKFVIEADEPRDTPLLLMQAMMQEILNDKTPETTELAPLSDEELVQWRRLEAQLAEIDGEVQFYDF